MATTTNYGWTTPDDTALVKDGAAAIRSLGTAIDTTVFNNAGAAIAKSLIDAKGDLIVGSAADTVARLAIGTNDYVLTADSGATNGIKWAALPAGGTRGLQEIVPTSVAVGSGTATVGANGLITVSGVGTNISVNGVFTSTYTNYKVVYALQSASSYTSLNIRMRASGTDNTDASSYRIMGGSSSQPAAASGFIGHAVSSDKWQTLGFVGVDGTNGAEITFYKPFVAKETAFTALAQGNAAGDYYFYFTGGNHTTESAFDGFSILTTQSLDGTITIYGWSE